jgi:hypothetical protein
MRPLGRRRGLRSTFLARSAEFRSGSADRVGGRDPRLTFELPDDARVMSRQSVYARSDLIGDVGERPPFP